MKNGGSFHSYFDITRGYPNTIRYETTQPIVISEVYHDLPHCFGSIVMLQIIFAHHFLQRDPYIKKVQIIQVYPSIRSIQMKQPQFFFLSRNYEHQPQNHHKITIRLAVFFFFPGEISTIASTPGPSCRLWRRNGSPFRLGRFDAQSWGTYGFVSRYQLNIII